MSPSARISVENADRAQELSRTDPPLGARQEHARSDTMCLWQRRVVSASAIVEKVRRLPKNWSLLPSTRQSSRASLQRSGRRFDGFGDIDRHLDRYRHHSDAALAFTAPPRAICVPMIVAYEWRGGFENTEINALHAQAFGTRLFDASEWNWVNQVERHSLGWVVARVGGGLVGFANVLSDGLVHAWLQDVMVDENLRHRGVGVELVRRSREAAAGAGCEYLHVDFEDDLRSFYFDACGFTPTTAGLMKLR